MPMPGSSFGQGGPLGALRNRDKFSHFVNREDEEKIFLDYLLAAEGTPLPVITFYAAGGSGKSWLLQKLMQKTTDEQTPFAHLDFSRDRNIGGQYFYNDSALVLSQIRQQLRVDCPRFDLAYHLMRFRQDIRDEAPGAFRAGDSMFQGLLEGAEALLNTIPGVNILKWVAERAAKANEQKFKETGMYRWLLGEMGKADYLRLENKSAQAILPELSGRLAMDLQESLPQPVRRQCRAVLFLDTYESLILGLTTSSQQSDIDAWIQRICADLNTAGVLCVLAGQNRLNWGAEWEPYLHQVPLEGLTRPYARTFLEKCGVPEGEVQEAILESSQERQPSGKEKRYFPLLLGLYADTVINEQEANHGATPTPDSFRLPPEDIRAAGLRFLRSLPDTYPEWIIRLAVTPRFDDSAARHAFDPHDTPAREGAWQRLASYSFVLPDTEEWWVLKEPVRRVLLQEPNLDTALAERHHRWWKNYWYSRMAEETDEGAALGWWHWFQLDPEEAFQEWERLIEKARTDLKMTVHHRLLDWLTAPVDDGAELTATQWKIWGDEYAQATVGNREWNLHKALALYESALERCPREASETDWAALQNRLGVTHRWLSDIRERKSHLHRAKDYLEAALQVYKSSETSGEWATVQTNLGNVYRGLAETGQGQPYLQKAIAAYEAALAAQPRETHPEDWAITQNNLGNAYSDYASNQKPEYLESAVSAYRQALEIIRQESSPLLWANIQNNLAVVYNRLSRIEDRESYLKQAIAASESAQTVFTRAAFAYQWAMIQGNIANAYIALATLHDGEVSIHRAIAGHEAALEVYTRSAFPQDWAMTQNNLAIAYSYLASIQDRESNLERAILHFRQAREIYTESHHPHQFAMLQKNLALLLHETGKTEDACAELADAIRTFDLLERADYATELRELQKVWNCA
ncbi:MAG: hypothetical protein OHK0029_19550 [Armatimonadaceae bacterium]